MRAYMLLGGAMHDSAIAAWGLKRFYDTARPITAVRYMAVQGQASSSATPMFNPNGIQLVPNHIEHCANASVAASRYNMPSTDCVGRIVARYWRPAVGITWARLDLWTTYQRPTFVTPPFPGLVSGHSTFSRAAAEVLTHMTGSTFFPGGLATFDVKVRQIDKQRETERERRVCCLFSHLLRQKNQFLVFETGPSESLQIQWATYQVGRERERERGASQ